MNIIEIISLVKLLLSLVPDVVKVIEKIVDPDQPEGSDLSQEVVAELAKALKDHEEKKETV